MNPEKSLGWDITKLFEQNISLKRNTTKRTPHTIKEEKYPKEDEFILNISNNITITYDKNIDKLKDCPFIYAKKFYKF